MRLVELFAKAGDSTQHFELIVFGAIWIKPHDPRKSKPEGSPTFHVKY